MKRFFLLMTVSFLATGLFAQSEKYIKAMESLVPQVDTTHSVDGLTDLANSFQRIADAEKTQGWPYYYVAVCLISKANMLYAQQQTDKIDAILDIAEPQLKKAEELLPDNSEVSCAVKMLNTGRMMADPMSRYMTYGPAAAAALETAKKLNPDNPRVYLLEGIDKYYTPEQFGGSKEEAKKLFSLSKEKFGSFKPASTIDPNWGLQQVEYFLSL